jgi:hypothetical protein
LVPLSKKEAIVYWQEVMLHDIEGSANSTGRPQELWWKFCQEFTEPKCKLLESYEGADLRRQCAKVIPTAVDLDNPVMAISFDPYVRNDSKSYIILATLLVVLIHVDRMFAKDEMVSRRSLLL